MNRSRGCLFRDSLRQSQEKSENPEESNSSSGITESGYRRTSTADAGKTDTKIETLVGVPLVPAANGRSSLVEPEPVQGYAELRKTDKPLYKALTAYVRSFDATDWGFRGKLRGKETWISTNTTEALNEWAEFLRMPKGSHKEARRFYRSPQALSLKLWEDHCEGFETLMVCSANSGKYFGQVTLCFDIDNHKGLGRVEELRALCDSILPAGSVFWQPSTSYTGLHGYWFLRSSMSSSELRTWTSTVQSALNERALAAGLPPAIELLGAPAIRTAGVIAEDSRGRKVKAPRLTVAEWKVYLSASRPIVSPEFVSTIITDNRASKSAVAEAWSLPCSRVSPVVSTIITDNRASLDSLVGLNPVHRLNRLSLGLANCLGRPPTEGEIEAAYLEKGLQTGLDTDGNRKKLIAAQAQYIEDNWDEAKASAEYLRQRDCLLSEVSEALTEDVMATVKKSSRVAFDNEIAALCLYCIKKASGTGNGVSQVGVTKMATKVGIEIEGNEEVQRRRVSAALRAIVISGIATTDEKYWFNAGSGRAKTYVYVGL